MAENLVIKHGNKGSLPSEKEKGTIYFTWDSEDKNHGKIYYDVPNEDEAISRADVSGCGYDMGNGAEIFNSYGGDNKNIAEGNCSHAEGLKTKAVSKTFSPASHSEGWVTVAENGGHSEGVGVISIGAGSHAEGVSGVETPLALFGKAPYIHEKLYDAEGNLISEENILSLWEENKVSLEDDDGNVVDQGGAFSLAKGTASHTEGYSNLALADFSHSEGKFSLAQGIGSHAEGRETIASGVSSHAEGHDTTASGDYSHAEGSSNTASGISSHVEGSSNTASSLASHAEGGDTIASGLASHAEGQKTIASGDQSHAEGYQGHSYGEASHVEGASTNLAKDFIYNPNNNNALYDDDIINSKWEENKFTLAKGQASHVEGKDTLALGNYSHAEGYQTQAEEIGSHAEGGLTEASGNYSHAEGYGTKASGNYSHAGGYRTIASNDAQTAIGKYNIKDDSGTYLFIVGNGTDTSTRSNAFTIDKDGNVKLKGNIYANGSKILPTKEYLDNNFAKLNVSNTFDGEQKFVHSIYCPWDKDKSDTASGIGCAFKATRGFFNQLLVDKIYIPKEQGNIAINKYTGTSGGSMTGSENIMRISSNRAVSRGQNCSATGENSFSSGQTCVAEGQASHAMGLGARAAQKGAFAMGNNVLAWGHQTVIGFFNPETKDAGTETAGSYTNKTSLFIIGNGTGASNRSNAFRVLANGTVYSGLTPAQGSSAFIAPGADFAEYFEWKDGNILEEDRRGLFVTLENDKIRLANLNDNYILGAVSTSTLIAGNAANENWQNKYLTDVFGHVLTEEIEIPETIDEETGEIIPSYIKTEKIINPNYNPDKNYISREFRKEWELIGLCGQVIVVDDGTCEVNGYCRPYVDGIASSFTIDDIDENIPDFMKEFYLTTKGFRVMERLDENHIKVLIK